MSDFAAIYATARDSADPVAWKALADFAEEKGCPWYALAYRAKAVCLGLRFRHLHDQNKHWTWRTEPGPDMQDWMRLTFVPESLLVGGGIRRDNTFENWWFVATGDSPWGMSDTPWSMATHNAIAGGSSRPTGHPDPPDLFRPTIDRFYAELLKRDGRVKTRPRFALA